MKIRLLLGALMAALAGAVQATIVVNTDWSTTTPITDGSAVGVTVAQTFTGLDPSAINGVSVDLNISGGYNGDLYGYLVLQDANGNMASTILLNRVGTSGGNPFGSSGSGFNVTLSDSGVVDIHNATGNPSGTFQADQYAGANSLNSTFSGLTANGTWTLFLADLSAGGGTSTLTSWGLDISVVPEPITWALLIFGLVLTVFVAGRLREKLQQKVLGCWHDVVAWVDKV